MGALAGPIDSPEAMTRYAVLIRLDRLVEVIVKALDSKEAEGLVYDRLGEVFGTSGFSTEFHEDRDGDVLSVEPV